ncbi:TetR/AcrR family transcriptional regulator [Actinoplanes flavus]|uniref:TetR/AcrR family transcriptional regulator n=1 Tax=Actinoplanes flavus TaxID=2820290 RepID=A0ABS3UY48_9ACTN|nr:TetR/AcrR family transcriptional regulator [Actinoplanes flavus]MBO3743505.1 TetR/AcrR family transcriptional regulator [Actinoplanes flavus]
MPPNAGRPPRLSLDAIVAAATRILETEGLEKLSMRRLATDLGSAPMAVYHHVRDKDELLVHVMEAQARAMPRPSFPDDPRERLIEASVLLYELLAERPWIVEVLTGKDLIGPSALWIVEAMIGAAADHGCSDDDAVYVYRTIWFYIVGDLVIRVARHGRVGETETVAALTAHAHPRLAAVAGRWAELNARDTHRRGITAIVDGLLA